MTLQTYSPHVLPTMHDEAAMTVAESFMPDLDANLARVVARGRAHAAESGELTPRRIGAIDSVFTDDARELVAEWQRDGGYERALIEIAAADPDLAVE